MNTQPSRLPELSDGRVDEIEDALFAEISSERREARTRRTRRGRIWMAGGAAAAVIAVAAVIAPTVGGIVRPMGGADSAVAPATTGGFSQGSGVIAEDSPVTTESLDAPESIGGAAASGARGGVSGERDIIASASATVVVADVATSATAVADAAESRGGYVESSNVGTSGGVVPVDPSSGMVVDTVPYPYTPDGAWVSVRVPSSELGALVDELADIGEVTASAVDRQDVTAQTIDLEARISAAQSSVDRLTELMGQAGSLSDLIAAESALSERQATLESYQQQLEALSDQVDMSSLTVTLTPEAETVAADPAGFGDGLAAGWSGLVATLNGVVIALGFLLPWLGVIAVAGLVVWGVRRAVVGRRRRRTDAADAESSRD